MNGTVYEYMLDAFRPYIIAIIIGIVIVICIMVSLLKETKQTNEILKSITYLPDTESSDQSCPVRKSKC